MALVGLSCFGQGRSAVSRVGTPGHLSGRIQLIVSVIVRTFSSDRSEHEGRRATQQCPACCRWRFRQEESGIFGGGWLDPPRCCCLGCKAGAAARLRPSQSARAAHAGDNRLRGAWLTGCGHRFADGALVYPLRQGPENWLRRRQLPPSGEWPLALS